ncbi:MAG: HIRAN domain-containing protein [Deltaproteobacteria bacterium]|nr:MAG: HIRAN domain-containing protein [Deltaproteobacteria bacterium]
MCSLFRWLFGKKESGKHYTYAICDKKSEAPPNMWYRLRKWKSPHVLRMETTWTRDWKVFSVDEPVVGVTRENRESSFLLLFDQPDFRIFLEREKDNPVDPNAIKVKGSATVQGNLLERQLGYLSKETAETLKGEEELDARPYCVYLPHKGGSYGLRLRVLIRSQSYKKKTGRA